MATIAWRVEGYEPLEGRAKWALVALTAAIAIDLVAIGSDVLEWRLLERFEHGEAVTLAEADANDARQALMGWLQLGALAVGAVFFIRWFHRAYANLFPLGAKDLRFGSGWAIGAWFVPILNLVRPKQIANDIWRGSDPDAPLDQGTEWRGRSYSGLLSYWWVAFLAAGWIGTAALSTLDGETAAELQRVTLGWIVADSLDAVAAVLAILVVYRTTLRQEARAARLASEQAGVI